MTQHHEQSRSEPDLEPGADRFWGQVSQTRAGRSQAEPNEDPGVDEAPGAGPDDTADESARTGPDDTADQSAGTGPDDTADQSAGGESGDSGHRHGHGDECLEWCPICRSAELIRTAVPPELRDQAEAFQREAVNIFRAFLTAYSERTGGPGTAPPGTSRPAADEPADTGPEPEPDGPRVTDIPLD